MSTSFGNVTFFSNAIFFPGSYQNLIFANQIAKNEVLVKTLEKIGVWEKGNIPKTSWPPLLDTL